MTPPPANPLHVWSPEYDATEYVVLWADLRGRDLENWEVLAWTGQWVRLDYQITDSKPEPPLGYPMRVRRVRPSEE